MQGLQLFPGTWTPLTYLLGSSRALRARSILPMLEIGMPTQSMSIVCMLELSRLNLQFSRQASISSETTCVPVSGVWPRDLEHVQIIGVEPDLGTSKER